MRRIDGLSDEQIRAYEVLLEAEVVAGLQRVMDAIADRIGAIQVAAAVLVAADGEEIEPEPEPVDDALPPGQPYVSPDDLATIPPAWQTVVAENLLPIAAEIWFEASGMIYSQMLEATGGAALPRLGNLAAEQYLAQARNTFEEIGDHLWGTAQAQLLEGFELGESIPQLADRLRDSAGIASRTGTLVARTQVIEASNFGSIATARASGLAMQKEWIATPDPRTRPTHIAADGQRVPLEEPFIVGGYSADFPAAPSLPPAERYNCLPGDALVMASALEIVYRRPYDGAMVTLHLASGGVLSATPNHPVLTDVGWQPIALLREGDHLVSSSGSQIVALRDPDVDHVPVRIDQVFDALAADAKRVAGLSVDFHGDGAEGEIEVVRTDRELLRRLPASVGEHVHEFGLASADALQALLVPNGAAHGFADVDRGAATGGISAGGEKLPAIGARIGHALEHGCAATADRDAGLDESKSDDVSTDAEPGRGGLFGLAGQVALDEIVDVEVNAFSGHVYNFQTRYGWYIANGIVVQNCRCTIGYLIPEREANRAKAETPPPPVEPIGREAPTGYPGRPGYPAQPGIPGVPGIPAVPGYPARPGVPGVPGYPGRPGYPARPPRGVLSQPGPDRGLDIPADGLDPTDATIRPELVAASTHDELRDAWLAEWQRITGEQPLIMIPPDASLRTMRQYAEGLLRAAERFPSVRLREIGWWSDPRGAYAELLPGTGGAGSRMRFNSYWASEAQRPALLRSLRADVKGWTGPTKSGWSVRGATSPQATSYHEFAHAMEMSTLNGRTRAAVMRAVERRAKLEGITPDQLVKRDISAYAGSDTNELIAEAFTDVMVNGRGASAISREIYDLLAGEYRAAGLGIRMVPRPDVDLDDFGPDADFTSFPSMPAPGLASRTVPQLRALAAERGVTIPAGARKADILRLLEEPGPDLDAPAPSTATARAMTPDEFDARLADARSGSRAESAPPVRVQIDASAGSDTGKWRATSVDGLSGAPASLLSAMTRRVRTSGHEANEILRFPDGVAVDERLREFVGPEKFDAQRAASRATGERNIKAIDKAMAESRLPSDVLVWRGVRPADIGLPDDAVGYEWVDLGYVGTSARREVAAGSFAQGATLRILAPKGTPSIGISGGGEAELLLGRGLRFRVVAERRTKAGGRELDVEIVPAAPVRAPAVKALTDQQIATAARAEIKRLEADRNAPDRLAAIERAQRQLDGATMRINAAKRGPDQDMYRAQVADEVGKALSELDELTQAGASAAATERRLTTLGHGLRPELLDELLQAGRLGDRDAVNAAIDAIAERHGLVRITGRSGDVEPFDPAKHEMAGRGAQPPVGSPVRVFRPAWAMKDSDRQLSRASVSVADDVPVTRAVAPGPRLAGDDVYRAVPLRDSQALDSLEQTAGIDEALRIQNAIGDYSDQGYQYVNAALRVARGDMARIPETLPAGVRGVIPSHYSVGRVEKMVEGIDAAMSRSALTHDIEVWRGVSDDLMFGPDASGSLVGRVLADDGYLSTSSGRALGRFTGNRAGIEMRIRVPAGTRAIGIENSQPGLRGEREILLERGLTLRVTADRRVRGVRTLDIEVVPAGTAPATAPSVIAPAVTSTRAAVARQAAIDKARAVGNLGAELLEQLGNEMSVAGLRSRITSGAARLGTPDKVRDALLAAVDDPAALRAAIMAALRGSKIDVVAGDAGQMVRFDRATMQAIDGVIPDDAQVLIVRPGLSFLRGKERIQISKATVEAATPEEILQVERRATRAAARERNAALEQASGTARLLAEVDQLIARGATREAIAERLDPALIERGNPAFGSADPAVLEALTAALEVGDMAKLKAAVTRLSTKAKIKPISRAGAKTKFDPATMQEAPGAPEIKAGAPVTVVTRGATVTLEDGTVVQIGKAVVTPVAKPVKAAKPKPTESLESRTRAVGRLQLTKPTDTRQLGGGQHADVEMLTYPRGTRAVQKTFGRRSPGSPAEIKREVDAEVLAPSIVDAVGVRAPGVVPSGSNGVLMEFIEGETFAERFPDFGYGDQDHWARIAAQYTETDDGRLMGLADYLMGNVDRNEGNWMILANGRYAAIDHGYAFTGDIPHGIFADYLRDGFRLRDRVDLNPADLAVVRRRLEALRPQFAASKRQRWHDDVMRRLREVETRADPSAPIRIAQ